ncbi:histidine--tRNA ligase [Flavihumibacter petaseus]|uniref:Histidine--tRNA ligase n=1 Tax=Flavihumibacter petaseus NBRC 106054 TaxID=1220578 RepID=A0A0E9MWL5_9BACT|nr:histidine--tRNA ligase [Flavihumibacter petaseus]GAO41500.1 histidyl-tRNA synthetase [Flavihumibacter petaseus NBRC 106054]
MSKPSLPSGTRDFGPEIVRKRYYIFQTIRQVFENYGFQPLETPAMENLETLMGKYGDEGDKLIFKILNNGLSDPDKSEKARHGFELVLAGKNEKSITERALRYDLTIPFARYVAMNAGQLALPFKRYQMQPVWRADKPQKGRYREFYQCDADIVGSRSLLNEVELTALYAEVFERLDLPVEIRINSRKLLAALAEACGGSDQLTDITVAIDKLDKIGIEKVKLEILGRGLNEGQWETIRTFLSIDGDNNSRLAAVESLLGHLAIAQEGITELRTILGNDPPGNLVLDFTLARGLNYYTGIIFEVKAVGVAIGSIGGGGRYDDLTGLFGLPGIPGVGISFGVDRIYDVLEALQRFPEAVQAGTRALFFNLGQAEARTAFRLMQMLRSANIPSELYHETAKFDKQFKYAEKKNIPLIIIIGSQELENNTCVIKDLRTGKQTTLPQTELFAYLSRRGA